LSVWGLWAQPLNSINYLTIEGDAHSDPFGTGQVTIQVHRNLFDLSTGSSIANRR
jgi:hypothetical protein